MVADAISSGKGDAADVAETARKAAAQVDRAADVIRHLRALVRLDRSNRAPCAFEQIVKETMELCRPDLDRTNVIARFGLAAGLPPVMVDLQIEQVLLNLMRNSIEAIEDNGSSHRFILIEARPTDKEFVEVRLHDLVQAFRASSSKTASFLYLPPKPDGLGIGLPLCRSIVEAHGGGMWLDASSQGASVRFTLPIARTSKHG